MAQNGLPNGAHVATQSIAHIHHDSALSLSSSTKEEDDATIRDLKDENAMLAEKTNTASQQIADYMNEIRVLEAKLRHEQRKNSVDLTDGAPKALPAVVQPVDRPGISRFGSFIGSRAKTTAVPQNGTLQAPPSREKELEEQLVKEQTGRIAAEKKVKEANAEVEELTATLFQQANEMVAAERKANAELVERVQVLEVRLQEKEGLRDAEIVGKENERLKEKVKVLEQREGDRKRRLERLESASKRIERVRGMLQPP